MALLQLGRGTETSPTVDHSFVAIRSGQLLHTFLVAAALAGAIELLLHRLAPPILAQVAGTGSQTATSIGELAAGATAVLVFLAVAAAFAARAPLSGALLVVAGTVLLASWWAGPTSMLALHTAVIVATATIAITAVKARNLYALGVALAAASVLTAQLPLMASVAWGSGAPVVAARGIAETAAIAAVLTLAVWLVSNDRPGPVAWLAAAVSGLFVAGALTFQPGFSAIGAIWVLGATLSLPPVLYVAGGAAAALVLATWASRPSTRPHAAALVLLIVAGIQPQVLHHDLTAVVAVAVLAGAGTPARLSRET